MVLFIPAIRCESFRLTAGNRGFFSDALRKGFFTILRLVGAGIAAPHGNRFFHRRRSLIFAGDEQMLLLKMSNSINIRANC